MITPCEQKCYLSAFMSQSNTKPSSPIHSGSAEKMYTTSTCELSRITNNRHKPQLVVIKQKHTSSNKVLLTRQGHTCKTFFWAALHNTNAGWAKNTLHSQLFSQNLRLKKKPQSAWPLHDSHRVSVTDMGLSKYDSTNNLLSQVPHLSRLEGHHVPESTLSNQILRLTDFDNFPPTQQPETSDRCKVLLFIKLHTWDN